jgi:hypothetical protein
MYSLSKLCGLYTAHYLATTILPDRSPHTTCHAISPGVIPTTRISRHTAWWKRALASVLLSWAPFVTRVEDSAEMCAKVILLEDGQAEQYNDWVWRMGKDPMPISEFVAVPEDKVRFQ